jgi:hypothetical protein
MTRWEVASAGGEGDDFGGLGLPAVAVSLTKNRHGPTGQWRLSWDHHERAFVTARAAALSLPVAGGGFRPIVSLALVTGCRKLRFGRNGIPSAQHFLLIFACIFEKWHQQSRHPVLSRVNPHMRAVGQGRTERVSRRSSAHPEDPWRL